MSLRYGFRHTEAMRKLYLDKAKARSYLRTPSLLHKTVYNIFSMFTIVTTYFK